MYERGTQKLLLIKLLLTGHTDMATTTMLTLTYSMRQFHSHIIRWVDGVASARPENDIRAQSDIPPEA